MPVDLRETETFWRDHQPWLQSKGYMLRPRYMPDWKPSWEGTNKLSTLCEDWLVPNVRRRFKPMVLKESSHCIAKRHLHGCDSNF